MEEGALMVATHLESALSLQWLTAAIAFQILAGCTSLLSVWQMGNKSIAGPIIGLISQCVAGEVISKGDRDALLIVLRKRDKAMRAVAAQRKAANMAEFEKAISREVRWQEDGTLAQAVDYGIEAAKQADKMIAERCEQLGIPDRFRPRLQWTWATRGENACKERRAELRLMAKAHFDAQEKEALAKVELHSLDVQEKLIAASLTSAEARAFLDKIPTIESLMPPMTDSEVKALFQATVPADIKKIAERARYDA